MSHVIRRARVRHTFGDREPTGWIPPHAARPPRGATVSVDLEVTIETEGDGYSLTWIGSRPEYCGDHWYMEIEYAEHAAEELFGISDKDWEPAP
jgi:hypothetical protein